jgi:hypothetical protein
MVAVHEQWFVGLELRTRDDAVVWHNAIGNYPTV